MSGPGIVSAQGSGSRFYGNSSTKGVNYEHVSSLDLVPVLWYGNRIPESCLGTRLSHYFLHTELRAVLECRRVQVVQAAQDDGECCQEQASSSTNKVYFCSWEDPIIISYDQPLSIAFKMQYP